MIKSFLFPTLNLVACVFITIYRHPDASAMIISVAVLLGSYLWTYYSVKEDTDNQWMPMAVSVAAPIILGIATSS